MRVGWLSLSAAASDGAIEAGDARAAAASGMRSIWAELSTENSEGWRYGRMAGGRWEQQNGRRKNQDPD